MVDDGGKSFGDGEGVRFFFYWVYAFTLTGVAAMVTSYFCPGIEGSGIPVRGFTGTLQLQVASMLDVCLPDALSI